LVTIQWTSVAGKTYRLEYKDALGAPAWQPLGPNVPAVGSATSATDNMGANAQRFYRVMLID